jgi:hypothetical protein
MGYVGGGNTAGILEDGTRGPYVDDDGDGSLDDGEHRLSSNPLVYALDYSADTTLTTAELQVAIDAADTAGDATVMLPCGNITITDPDTDGVGITVPEGVNLKGCGMGATGMRNSFVMDSEDDAVIYVEGDHVTLSDFNMQPTNHTDTGGSQIRLVGQHALVERVRAQGWGNADTRSDDSTGIYCDGSQGAMLIDVRSSGWLYGVRLNYHSGSPCNELGIFGGHITSNTNNVYIDEDEADKAGCGGMQIYGTVIEGQDTIGVHHEAMETADDNGCTIRTYGVHFENIPALNSTCTDSATPYPCCTGAGTGTCLESGTNVKFGGIGGSLSDHGSLWGTNATNHIDIGSGNKLPHTSVGSKWNDPYNNADCAGADDPVDCCTGAGTGTCGDVNHNGTGPVSILHYQRNTVSMSKSFTVNGSGPVAFSDTIRSADCTAEPTGGYEFYAEGQICVDSNGTFICNPGTIDAFCNGDGGGDPDVWDPISGAINTADIADVSVTQTELAELETIGATSIEAADWTAVAAMSGVNTGDDDVPEAGDFGNATELDANGALSCTGCVGTTEAAGIDISADTNLAVSAPVVLTDDTLSFDEVASIATSTGGALAINTATIATAAADYDLPDNCDSATGAWAMLYVRDAAETVSLTVTDAADTIKYKGLSLGANDELDSPGAAQDSVTVVCFETNLWYVTDNSGAWTDGGVPD